MNHKMVLLASLCLSWACSNAMEQVASEKDILWEYFQKIEPLKNEYTRLFKELNYGRASNPALERELAAVHDQQAQLAEDYLKRLKALYPNRYKNVHNLNIFWRKHAHPKDRKADLLSLLKNWRDPHSPAWSRIPSGFDMGNLEGKSDEELEKIAHFYAIPEGAKL